MQLMYFFNNRVNFLGYLKIKQKIEEKKQLKLQHNNLKRTGFCSELVLCHYPPTSAQTETPTVCDIFECVGDLLGVCFPSPTSTQLDFLAI